MSKSDALSQLTPGVWTIDPGHSHVGFVARHLMVAKVRGSFGSFTGSVTIAEDRLQSSVQASVDMASINTGDDSRDGHLKGNDFFDIENHPTMTFTSTAIRSDGDDYVMVGDLTLRGVTKAVEFEVEFEGVAADPWGNTKAGFTAEAEINRKDWGVEWNAPLEAGGVLVGEKVKIQLDVELLKG
jgi:polyisoprenoid-binding protein YceI